MGVGYFRNVDDSQSDPDNIVARYLSGHNAALEVALTLEEYAENIKSASGGNQGSPQLIADVFSEGGADGGREGECPEISQRLLTKDGYLDCAKIYDKHLEGDVFLFNPLTGHYNLITNLRIVPADIVEIVTSRARLVCSTTHKVIKNTQDRNGTWFGAADEVLTHTGNCFIDHISEVNPLGEGKVMNITLATEFIYIAEGILSHNRKLIDLNTT